mmetsp:Transcript_51168/g.153729  ORF Transcript_51168/g.153729 Transcript_51168/m.153729 type:complete len:677 (-) Transcript_51168:83-2113(-)
MPTRMLCDERGNPIFPPTFAPTKGSPSATTVISSTPTVGVAAAAASPAIRKEKSGAGATTPPGRSSSAGAERSSSRTPSTTVVRSGAPSSEDDSSRTIASILVRHRSREALRRNADVVALAEAGGDDVVVSSSPGRKRPRGGSSSSFGTASSCTDVLAAVIAVNDPRYRDAPDARRMTVDVTIGDGSLPPGCAARAVFKVSSAGDYGGGSAGGLPGGAEPSDAGCSPPRVTATTLGVGDVVLFRGLAVRRDYGGGVEGGRNPTGGGAISGALTTVLCELHRPWWKDEGSSAAAAMRPFDLLSRASRRHESFGGCAEPSWDSVFRDKALRERVEGVAAWYRSNHGGPSFVSPTKVLGDRATLRCRRRRLRDVDNPGLLSDVTVRVLSYDGSAPRPSGLGSSSSAAARRRGGPARRWDPKPVTARASLSDGPDESDLAALYDCARFGAALNNASRAGSCVLITRVKSHWATKGSNGGREGGGMALVPTPETSVMVLEGEGPTRKQGRRVAASQRDGITQTRGMTQTQVPSPDCLVGTTETAIVTSALKDIVVVCDGEKKNSISDCLGTPSALFEVLVDANARRPTYCIATLTLDSIAAPGEFLVVEAGGDVVEVLCGSCPAACLSTDSRVGKGDTSLRTHAFNLLRGMLREKVPLRWTLRRAGPEDIWRVTDVMLPKI